MSWWIDLQKKLLWKMDQLYTTIYQRGDRNKRKRQWTSYVGTAVDRYEKRGSYESFFPISEEEVNTENTSIPRVNFYANRTWENRIILIQTWTNR